MNKKRGFTLAEVLITLAIVGVVAALTLPNLIANYKKKSDVAKLKKAYTTLQQAFRRSEVDNGFSENWDLPENTGVYAYWEKYWEPYFSNPTRCLTTAECGFDTSYPYTNLNGNTCQLAVVPNRTRVIFSLIDGTMYIILTANGSGDGGWVSSNHIYVDINGAKKPNVIGRDVFQFERVNGKGIMPIGYNYTNEIIERDCSLNGTGSCCARKIMLDGWEMNY